MKPRAILEATADIFGVTLADLIGPRRYRRIADAKLAAAYTLRQVGISLREAGELLGRDTSTIVQNAKAAAALADRDPAFAARLRALAAAINPVEPPVPPPVRRPLVMTPQLRLWLWSQRDSIAMPATA